MPVTVTPQRPATSPAKARRVPQSIPALENGDTLAAAEFLRRYEAQPRLKNAQLIEGVVHMPSPVRAQAHAQPDGLIHVWLGTYALEHPNLRFYPNATLLLDADNAPQPDAILCTAPRDGGNVWLNADGYLCGKPELVCEVAASTAAVDMHAKLRAYRRNGVKEYLVWLTSENEVKWFRLQNDTYVEAKESGGKLRSEVFPGLVLDVKALLKMDGPKVIAALKSKK